MLGWDIYRWLLLFQEFDFEIIGKHVWLNLGLDHISRIESGEEPNNLDYNVPDAQLFSITMFDDHYRDIIKKFSTGYTPTEFSITQKKQLVVCTAYF